ncbi:MAG: glutamate-5-semialdehyde dehydrogenase [Spirochaetota bacterium]
MERGYLKENIGAVHAVQKQLALISPDIRSRLLTRIADKLEEHRERVFEANSFDLARAAQENLSQPLVKRLKFDASKLEQSCEGLRQLAQMPDPVGQNMLTRELDSDLILSKESCPIGVIGMIFESRPDALLQIAGLCIKSANGVVLKGGSEALETNRLLVSIIQEASSQIFPPEAGAGWILLLESREDVQQMLDMQGLIDLIIPRGSNQFVQFIMDHTNIPVLGHADGVCHCYIDKTAQVEQAVRIAVDSKCQYPAACNAIETILVHQDRAQDILPPLAEALETAGVEIRGDEQVQQIIRCTAAQEDDWGAEYLDLIVSIKVVTSLSEAVEYIHRYGSSHTDCIVTEDAQQAEFFMGAVDSADVFWNCSTRFADGYRFGLGAEVGISTHKIHARGPVGIEGLMSYKWKLRGTGQIVQDYTGEGAKRFTHRDLT